MKKLEELTPFETVDVCTQAAVQIIAGIFYMAQVPSEQVVKLVIRASGLTDIEVQGIDKFLSECAVEQGIEPSAITTTDAIAGLFMRVVLSRLNMDKPDKADYGSSVVVEEVSSGPVVGD